MEGSTLNVTVVEAQGLQIDIRTTGTTDVFVTVSK